MAEAGRERQAERHLAGHGGSRADVRGGDSARRRPRRGCRAGSVRSWAVAAHVGAGARCGAAEGRRAAEGASARARATLDDAGRSGDQLHALRFGTARRAVRVLRQLDPFVSPRRRAPPRQRRPRARRQGAGRRRRGDHAVECAAGVAVLQGCRRARRGLHDRREAGAGDARRRLHPRRMHRGRRACRRACST